MTEVSLRSQLHQLVDALAADQLEITRALLKTLRDATVDRGNFTSLLGITIESTVAGQARTSLDLDVHLLNRLGILHGGAAFALADVTTGIAAYTLLEKHQKIVTQDLHYRYHGMARQGRVEAQASVVHLGKRTVVVRCNLTQEERLLGTADGTFALIESSEIRTK